MWFLDAGERLGRSFTSFRDRWFRPEHIGADSYSTAWVPFPHSQDEIQALIKDICLTLDAKDYFDIKEPIVVPVRVHLPDEARGLYRQMEKEMFTEIDGHAIEAVNAANVSMKCLQMASGNVWVDAEIGLWKAMHDVKLDALDSIIDEANGMPVLVSYQWKPSLERILKRFPFARVLANDKRTEDEWNAGRIPLLVAHPQSVGHGLNLQYGGNIIAFYDHWWALEERMQILERIGPVRQMQAGLDRPVWVYNIIADNTVDELVLLRHETRRSVQDILLEAMKGKRYG
jgi:SNF2 family DNA or RNA helicase